MVTRRRAPKAEKPKEPMDCRLHRNCHRCRTMSEEDRKALDKAIDHPGRCLRCEKPDCYGGACLTKKDRRILEFAASVSPDHWTQPLIPMREQF